MTARGRTRTILSRRRVLVVLGVVAALPLVYLAVVAARAVRGVPGVRARALACDRDGVRAVDLPPEWRRILLAVEDPGFYGHAGVDLRTPGQGLTTITQALAKIHCFERFTPGPLSKLEQSIHALALDRGIEKDLQLTLLLDTANLGEQEGRPVTGFPAAASAYFRKDLRDLTREEFVTLVAMLIAPNRLHPEAGRAALADRVARIEALLAGRCEPRGLTDVWYEACPGKQRGASWPAGAPFHSESTSRPWRSAAFPQPRRIRGLPLVLLLGLHRDPQRIRNLVGSG